MGGEPAYRTGDAMSLMVAAGIDAGKAFLDLAIACGSDRQRNRSVRVENTAQGIEKILEVLSGNAAKRVILEAIGPYAAQLVRALLQAGYEVGLVNPKRIKAFREAEGKRAKTDRLDAQLIARFGLVMSDTLRPVPSEDQLAAKALAARRRQIVEMIAMEKTRLKQASEPLVMASHRSAIKALSGERKAIEAELERRLTNDPEIALKRDCLMSMPGIAEQTSSVLLTEMPELGTLNRHAIAGLAGLAPHPDRSGLNPGRNAISGGRPCVRAALYMAALAAIRHNPRMKRDYQALRDQGKPAKVAIIAIARKLLVMANALVRDQQKYDPAKNTA
jgi:transposase